MKKTTFLFPIVLLLLFARCGKEEKNTTTEASVKANSVTHASGFKLFENDGFTLIEVNNPWPGAKSTFRYLAVEKSGKIPDSLASLPQISVPVKSIIVSSTTHIPSLEMLEESDKLVAFPHCEWISSEVIRKRVESGKVAEIGNNQALNMEKILDIDPGVFIGYGIDNNNAQLDNLRKAGIPVVLNGDWNETSALGKAEWIKLFGVLFGKKEKAEGIFKEIVSDYESVSKAAKSAKTKPTVMAGAIYENKWILPEGNSWGAEMIALAGGNYLWADSKGTGSLSLSFESVLDKASEAEFWIGPGQYTSLKEMATDNQDYALFKSYKDKKVFSFSTKKGKTGGIRYYELAPNRPDLVLKDLVKILHPEVLPNHQLFFFEQLP